MFQVVFKFAVNKPTSSSQEHAMFNYHTFPDVVVCVNPAIDQEVSRTYGYKDPFAYSLGYTGWGESFVGWNGERGDNNSAEILDELMNVKTKDSGVISTIYYIENGVYTYKTPATDFRMMMFPYCRCQLVTATKNLNSSGLFLGLNTSNILKLSDNVKDSRINILLMDPVNSPLMFPITFQMRGTQINLKLKRKGFHQYLVKISQSHNVEMNPQFDCKDYSPDNTYGECIKKELTERFEELLNCTPPMISTSRMCNKILKLNEEEATKIKELFVQFSEQFESKL